VLPFRSVNPGAQLMRLAPAQATLPEVTLLTPSWQKATPSAELPPVAHASSMEVLPAKVRPPADAE